ncbi:MAG: hypothetical protein FLDDKLPJ_02893 [Phycisphaerae bacterium]|nr:hypothetical protein [Phycisphaerae bacterium]
MEEFIPRDPRSAAGRRLPRTPLTAELRCPQCGYDLRGIPQERCPECGFGFDVAALRDVVLRAGLMLIDAYQTAARRGAWVIGLSLAVIVLCGGNGPGFLGLRAFAGLVTTAALGLYYEHGSPANYRELLIDWGLPLFLIAASRFSSELYELVQWAMVAEIGVTVATIRPAYPQLQSALDARMQVRLRNSRRAAIGLLGASALTAALI